MSAQASVDGRQEVLVGMQDEDCSFIGRYTL
jgi:hypothetical protein